MVKAVRVVLISGGPSAGAHAGLDTPRRRVQHPLGPPEVDK
jgi:hypothetical protein